MIAPERTVLADERMKSAKNPTNAVYDKLTELAEVNRKSYEAFYNQLVLVSGGTVALSVTYLGYLRATQSPIAHFKLLAGSWIVLLICLLLSVFSTFFYSHYLTYARQAEYGKRLAEQFEMEANELPYVRHLPRLTDDELQSTCEERRQVAQKRRKDSEWNKDRANFCWFVWKWGGLCARVAIVVGIGLLIAFAIINLSPNASMNRAATPYAVPAGAPKVTTSYCNPYFDGWKLAIPWTKYIFLYCVPAALLLRLAHGFLRARAVQKGDFPHEKERAQSVKTDYWQAFRLCFLGFGDYKEHADLWIPFGIGIAELAAFPVLLTLGQIVIIGGWLGIKTAGAWMGWQASRTSFNRFLLFNILTVSLSYLWLSRYVERLPCQ